MASPRRDSPERFRSGSLSSSPRTIPAPRDGSRSPVRLRRTDSAGSSGEGARPPPRHSPALARPYAPHDPESRERQRTLDVDMALHLSRARNSSVSASSPAAAGTPADGGSSAAHHRHPAPLGAPGTTELPSFTEGEEAEFAAARHGGPLDTAAPTIDIDAKSDFHFPADGGLRPTRSIDTVGGGGGGSRSPFDLPHLSMGHDPELLYAHDLPGGSESALDVPGGGLDVDGERAKRLSGADVAFLPPVYQPSYGHTFDFGAMESFAGDERQRLGIDSPAVSPAALPAALRWTDMPAPPRRTTSAHLAMGDADGGSDGGAVSPLPAASAVPGLSAPRMRHRKMSSSKTTPRARGGGAKKTALFEGTLGAPPPTLAGGSALGAGLLAGNSHVPSQDNIFAGANGPGEPGSLAGAASNGVPAGVYASAPAAAAAGAGYGHDRPYRFSFYSNALSATIHARSLAELPAEGQTFEDLFLGGGPRANAPPPDAKGGPSDAADTTASSSVRPSAVPSVVGTPNPPSHILEAQRRASMAGLRPQSSTVNGTAEPAPGYTTPARVAGAAAGGEGVTWWLDVLSPTDEEMKMLSKVFSIHPLTTEDILMEETREKIELFRNYYLCCFRSFDQDPYSPTYLEPLNMYIIVFREGTLSFHFRATPHPQNVRRRIKQLKDYISVTSDWISYALIDDITDAFGPLIQSIEYEVDSIDELVLILKEAEQSDMLRRIGTCRKKVMGLLRLMGNKADVVKGLAKRCNENWRVAPTSDIGLYLSDIQDHLITMTQNLNHYEKILSRSHSNYLAQISIEMTEANNQINDVLSKMTALGTILIPMNLVTGLWGMNVNVPGQEASGLTWFASILAGLLAFAVAGGYITFRLMSSR